MPLEKVYKKIILGGLISQSYFNLEFLWKRACFNIKNSPYGYRAFQRNLALSKIIKDQRVLIIGSGLSANELNHIPGDVKVLTCNIGPRVLLNKGIDRQIDLYFCATLMGGHKEENVIELLSKCRINLFIISKKELKKNKVNFKRIYDKCIDKCVRDRGINNYYMKKIIGRKMMKQIQSQILSNNWPSSGMRLLQYALYFKAKEIYLIGIDINEEGYFWGRKNINEHLIIDKDFIKIVSGKYKHIYSAAKNSPITRYLKYKPLF